MVLLEDIYEDRRAGSRRRSQQGSTGGIYIQQAPK
jgi:hypothetical protein